MGKMIPKLSKFFNRLEKLTNSSKHQP